MKPTKGRIVHYFPADSADPEKPERAKPEKACAAIVTGVTPKGDDGRPERVSLHVFPPGAAHAVTRVEHSPEPAPGCWSWPEKKK